MPLSWLVVLSDPEGLKLSSPPPALSRGALNKLLDVAEGHGVLPATVSNLSAMIAGGFADLVANGGKEDIESILASKRPLLRTQTAFSLLLRQQANHVIKALSSKWIPAFILKGAHFADRLYSPSSLRAFTDVDIIVPFDAMAEVSSVLKGLGYRRIVVNNRKHFSDYGQEAWKPDGWAGGIVEIHWDLVNSPAVRGNISCCLNDLQFEDSTEITQTLLSPASLLLVSAIHAATSHSYDRLLQLYDIRQICLGKAGNLDEAYLLEMLGRKGYSACVMIGLHLCRGVLRSEECREVADRLKLTMPASLKPLITPSMLQREPNRTDKLRRKILREVLKRT